MVKNYEYYNSDGTSGPSQVIHINRLQKYSGNSVITIHSGNV